MNTQTAKIRLAITLVDVKTGRIFVLHINQYAMQRTITGSTDAFVLAQKTEKILRYLVKNKVINDFEPHTISSFDFEGSDVVVDGIQRIFMVAMVNLDPDKVSGSRYLYEAMPILRPISEREHLYQRYLIALKQELVYKEAA
ncbi:hypothetical protein KC723_01310 [Candidatus Kaiserbacteria bacterium]|nr:hypothetical protein [Candidatus Kaiserbacteria bacterium]